MLCLCVAALALLGTVVRSAPAAAQTTATRESSGVEGTGRPSEPSPPVLRGLKRIYLMTHALNWLEITPDDPRRQTELWEQWPGRCEICHRYEFGLKDKYYQLMGAPDESTGVFCLLSGMKGDLPLIELAKQTFGDRCVVCRLGYDLDANRKALGEEFARDLDADRQRARDLRGDAITEGEIAAWERSKAWAADLRLQFEERGYTFDPADVEFIAFGEDWCGCAATFPIHMGKALGLTEPIFRRFDLMNPDCSPLLLRSTALEQNLAMPESIRLFLFRTDEGQLLAQYWEGMHALWDKPHSVVVDFPPESVRLIDLFGKRRGEETYGQVTMNVGCGGHTPHRPDLIAAEPELSFEDFRKALLAGRVKHK